MTSVSYTNLSGTIVASELNSNFSDVVSIASSVGNEQLSGGITADKLTDRYSLSYDTMCLVPAMVASSGGAITFATEEIISFASANATSLMLTWQPTMRTGTEAYLCSIQVQAAEVSNDPEVACYLNGTTTGGSLIGGDAITLAAAATPITLAQPDPISAPLIAMTNGDYINVYLQDSGGDSRSGCRGVYITFCMKYVLQS